MARSEMETLIPGLSSQIEVIQQLDVFSYDEIKAIKNHRKHYVKTFSRDKISCDDIILYVRYELDLLAVVREKKVKEDLLKTKNIVMYSSANLLNKLFSVLTRYYPEKLQLWFLYVEFCRGMNDTTTLLYVMDRLLKKHKDKPFVFQLAARVAREDLKNLGQAREYLMAGIRAHIDSQELYREAFSMELAVSRQKFENAEQANPDDQVFRKTLEHVYNAARMKIHNVEFYIDLFHSLKGVPFANALKSQIQDELRKRFPNKEIMWETLANVKFEQLKIPENAPNIRKIIEEMIEIYREAVEEDHLNTPLMWSLYIDKVVEIRNDASLQGITNFKKNCLITALTNAHIKKKLSVKHYLLWAELQKNEENKLQLLQVAARNWPTDVTLWTNILLKRLAVQDENGAWKLFKEALGCFKNDKKASLPLWKFMAQYYLYVPCPDSKIQWFFDKAISESSGVDVDMKPFYLEWWTVNQGITHGRELYEKIAPVPPFSMPLHEKMMELESYQVKLNVRSMRRVFELASEQFGTHDTEIWMKWIQFEYNLGKSRKIILNIKDKAMALLQPALIDEFSLLMRIFEIECLTSWKEQAVVQKLDTSLCRKRKRGSSTSARHNGRPKRQCT